MAVRLVFLGRLADVAGTGEMLLDEGGAINVLLARLAAPLAEALAGPRIKRALNGVVLAPGALPVLGDGDELAFLPPVSGG